MARRRLGEILVGAKVITEKQLEYALGEQRRWGGQVGKILIDAGYVTEEVLVRALGKQLNIPIVTLKGVTISESVLETVPVELAEQHGVIPFQQQLNFLDVAMSDPMNMGIIDELRIRTRLNVRPHLAASSEISDAIRRSYGSDLDLGGGMDGGGIDVDFEDGPILRGRSDNMSDMREAEIVALQKRISALEALVKRDEDVIRKLLALLVRKGVATREEVLEAIK